MYIDDNFKDYAKQVCSCSPYQGDVYKRQKYSCEIKKTGTEKFSPVLFYSTAGSGCRQPAVEMIFCKVLPSAES